MKALRLTICTMMVFQPKSFLSFILHSLCVEGLVCSVSRSGSDVHHGLFFTKVEACFHHHPCKPARHKFSRSDEGESQNSELGKTALDPKTPPPNVSTLLTTISLDAQEREGSMVKVKRKS
jgi:hypothetical protein